MSDEDIFISQPLSSEDEVEMPNSIPSPSSVMQPTPSASTVDDFVTPRLGYKRPPTRRARGGRAGGRTFGRNTQRSTSAASEEDPNATPSSSSLAEQSTSAPATPSRRGPKPRQIATPQDIQSLSPRRTRSARRSTDSSPPSRPGTPLFQVPSTPKGRGRRGSRSTTPASRPTSRSPSPSIELPATPRGRGRPRGSKASTPRGASNRALQTSSRGSVESTPTRKGPGRPRTRSVTPSVEAQATPSLEPPASPTVEVQTTPKRGCGRPPGPNSTPRDRARQRTPVTTPQPSTSAVVQPQQSTSAAVQPQPSTSAQADAADAAATVLSLRPYQTLNAPLYAPMQSLPRRTSLRHNPHDSSPSSSSSSSLWSPPGSSSSGEPNETEAERHRRYRNRLLQNDADEHHDRERQRVQQHRRDLSPLGSQIIRERNNARHRVAYHQRKQQRALNLQEEYDDFIQPNAIRDGPPKFNEAAVPEFLCGPFTVVCRFCSAFHFAGEANRFGDFKNCCRFGAVQLNPPVQQYPGFLKDALTDRDNFYHDRLRRFIRNYNSALSFVSLGANITEAVGRGPFCFIIQGSVYHYMTHLNVPENVRLTYAQLYFLDSATQAHETRATHPANHGIDRILLRDIQDVIMQNNIYARTLYNSHQRIQNYLNDPAYDPEAPMPELVFNREFTLNVHPGRQNEPAAGNEIAAVFVLEGSEGTVPFHRDFSLSYRHPNDNQYQHINVISPHLDPLTYALLFPFGDPGWHVGWTGTPYPGSNAVARRVTLLNYRSAQMQQRRTMHNDRLWRPIVHSGNLFQQFVVDAYLGVEANNLTWIRFNQDQIWADRYEGLNRWIQRAAERQEIPAAPAIILPSSFTGSMRNMQQLCKDAMAIFGRLGKPDLFITFTCNPQWADIRSSLLPGEQAHDRPDIVARVFKLKLNELMEDIKTGLLGTMICYVYTIEFQKRGLPHAHILVTLQQGSKLIDGDSIDRIVCAELPDPDENPRLHEIVSRVMVHGPCEGRACLTTPRVTGKELCSKGFPKPFRFVTCVVSNNYPQYRRVDTPALEGRNGFIVPYNPYLTLKYNGHINVEVLTSMHSAIMYIYKYIFKGFDVANLVMNQRGELEINEIKNYINARYVSAPEAIWRLFEFVTHDRSHSVDRLPIHLEAETDDIDFNEYLEEQPMAERANPNLNSKLNAFFALNVSRLNDQDTRDQPLLYSEVPLLYVWRANERRWHPRQRGADKIVSRIHEAGGPNSEIFALRMLLINIRGPRSFAELRSIGTVVHPSFLAAARARNLMPNANIVADTLADMAILRRSPALRGLFVMMVILFKCTNGDALWDRFKDSLSDDLKHNNPNETDDYCYNLALQDLNRRFIRMKETPQKFNVPLPDDNVVPPPVTHPQLPIQQQPFALNQAQQRGFDRIMAAARNHNQGDQCFVVIGPGGSGKTTLYRHIIQACRAGNLRIEVFATTGIAATMLEGGKTVHSGFGFLPDMNSMSTPYLVPNTPKAELLRLADVILIDEITILNYDGLRLINDTLDLIMNNRDQQNVFFGGKTIVVGGDFRQLLPVVPGKSRAEIIAMSVVRNPLWAKFRIISLTENMRAQNNPEFVNWLLRVGTGTLRNIPELEYLNMIEIPQDMLLVVPDEINPRVRLQHECSHELATMITAIFGDDIATLTREDLSQRAILATTVKQVTMVNDHIIQKLDGLITHYFSVDRIDDPHGHRIADNYPIEFLYSQQPSGLPPHDLGLKVGCVVMLIRNLNMEEGLSNGTRLIIRVMRDFGVEAEILSESHRGDICFIPKIELDSTQGLPFKMYRLQLPLIPAYAMTINKCQGQTLEHVGIYLNDVVFSHGQLYVALSRSRTRGNIKIYINECASRQGHLLRRFVGQEHRVFTRNVVYKEVFQHNELNEVTERLPENHITAEEAQLIFEDAEQEEREIAQRLADSQPLAMDNVSV